MEYECDLILIRSGIRNQKRGRLLFFRYPHPHESAVLVFRRENGGEVYPLLVIGDEECMQRPVFDVHLAFNMPDHHSLGAPIKPSKGMVIVIFSVSLDSLPLGMEHYQPRSHLRSVRNHAALVTAASMTTLSSLK